MNSSKQPSREDALLHAAIDDELTRDERVEFNRLLATSADARERYASLQRLTLIVEEIGPVAPPADLARATARAVSMRKTVGVPVGRTLQGEISMARKRSEE